MGQNAESKSDEYFRVMNFSDSLSACVTNESSWDGCQNPPARWLSIVFHALDKEAVFFGALGAFDAVGFVGGRVPVTDWNDGRWEELRKKSDSSVEEVTESLPMLRRFLPEYEDVSFSASEIHGLLNECLTVRAQTDHAAGRVSLDKLIAACNEALKDRSGLFFASQ